MWTLRDSFEICLWQIQNVFERFKLTWGSILFVSHPLQDVRLIRPRPSDCHPHRRDTHFSFFESTKLKNLIMESTMLQYLK